LRDKLRTTDDDQEEQDEEIMVEEDDSLTEMNETPASQSFPDELPLLPLRGVIIFTYDVLHTDSSPNPKAWNIKFGFSLGRFKLKDLQI